MFSNFTSPTQTCGKRYVTGSEDHEPIHFFQNNNIDHISSSAGQHFTPKNVEETSLLGVLVGSNAQPHAKWPSFWVNVILVGSNTKLFLGKLPRLRVLQRIQVPDKTNFLFFPSKAVRSAPHSGKEARRAGCTAISYLPPTSLQKKKPPSPQHRPPGAESLLALMSAIQNRANVAHQQLASMPYRRRTKKKMKIKKKQTRVPAVASASSLSVV